MNTWAVDIRRPPPAPPSPYPAPDYAVRLTSEPRARS